MTQAKSSAMTYILTKELETGKKEVENDHERHTVFADDSGFLRALSLPHNTTTPASVFVIKKRAAIFCRD